MAEKRFTLQGFRDYRGVQLPDIIEDIKGYRDRLEKTLEEFESLKAEVEKSAELLDEPDALKEKFDYIIGLFKGHWEDLVRLSAELSFGVKENHIEIVGEIYESCKYENRDGYRSFKEEYISRTLKDESMRELLDKICLLYGSTAFSFLIFNGIKSRLKTFLETKQCSASQELGPALEEERPVAKVRTFRCPKGSEWEDINLIFNPGGIIRIEVKGIREERTFAECGLSDRRSDEKTSLLLSLLIELSKNGGKIEGKHIKDRYLNRPQQDRLKANIKRLRKALRELFVRIDGDPIPCKNSVYEAKFKTIIREEPDVPIEPIPKLFSSDGIRDPKIREVYGADIQSKIVIRRKSIEKAIRKELGGDEDKDDK
jgi:hypothetical protein